MLVPFQWIGPVAALAVFVVMFALGLVLGREQIIAALQRRIVLAAVVFAVVVPVPALAVLAVKLFSLKGPAAAGLVLMSISARGVGRAAARARPWPRPCAIRAWRS